MSAHSPKRVVHPARVLPLGDSQTDSLADSTTAEERIEMVAVLSARMWELTGRSVPQYSRAKMPIRVIRRP